VVAVVVDLVAAMAAAVDAEVVVVATAAAMGVATVVVADLSDVDQALISN
jgi:hypothetical protein